ncbi:U3 small nucleolar RNA-associated protein 14 [Fusarium oxysporum f. sp. albedinis]|nr:U3 small nucleolar RNA-associated protein 14 [Fusarium oxysporum f. sp. albedinis]
MWMIAKKQVVNTASNLTKKRKRVTVVHWRKSQRHGSVGQEWTGLNGCARRNKKKTWNYGGVYYVVSRWLRHKLHDV